MSNTDDIWYAPFRNEESDLQSIMVLCRDELSEPYNVFTFRYFLEDWSHLCFFAYPPLPLGSLIQSPTSRYPHSSNRQPIHHDGVLTPLDSPPPRTSASASTSTSAFADHKEARLPLTASMSSLSISPTTDTGADLTSAQSTHANASDGGNSVSSLRGDDGASAGSRDDADRPPPIGCIVCKQEIHKGVVNRGYIGMLSVDRRWRRKGIAKQLVNLAVQTMIDRGADEIILETEFDNVPSLTLYQSLGFRRSKRLYRFYLNGKDASERHSTRTAKTRSRIALSTGVHPLSCSIGGKTSHSPSL